MVSREILEAQKGLYEKGKQQAMVNLEKAKADFSAINGAIKACDDLLRIISQMEEAECRKDQKPELKAEKKA